jgi:hypothetical protein
VSATVPCPRPPDDTGCPVSEHVCCWAEVPDAHARLPRSTREGLDPGIRKAVEVLSSHGVETYESCQGGPDPARPDRGHAYPEPTVAFHGTPAAGWHALGVAIDHGLPLRDIRRVWRVTHGEITGPTWEMTFTGERR